MEKNPRTTFCGSYDANGSFIYFGPLRTVPMGVRVISGIVGIPLLRITQDSVIRLSVFSALPIIAALPSVLFLIVSITLLVKRK